MSETTKKPEEPLKEAADACLLRESNEEKDAVAESMAESEVSSAEPLAAEEHLVEEEEQEEDFEMESESEDSDLDSGDEEWDLEPEPPARRPKRTESEGIEETMEAWKGTDEEDVEPEPLTFRPARTPGTQLLQGVSYTYLELFQSFLPNSILQTVVINTNKYGKEKHTDWKEITLKDLYSYLSMRIYMGLLRMVSLPDYWNVSDPYNHPFPASVISARKFSLIATSIQMSDPEDDLANSKKKGTADYDRLCKIKPMYEELRKTCQACYHPRQNIAVDERVVQSKAPPGRMLYVEIEQNKRDLKICVLADSSNGYTWDFTVFEGRINNQSEKGLGYDTVMDLVRPTVLGTGYNLYLDHFYTSPTLFLDLLEKGIGACGNIRSIRLGSHRRKSGQLENKSVRGSIRWIREGPIVFVQWKDARDVLMCSTVHKAHGEETVQKKKRDLDGQWAVKSIAVPPARQDYNTNVSDAPIGCYSALREAKKWYRSFFYHFVDIAVANAFILHQELARAKGERMITQTAFREALVLELQAAGTPVRARQTVPRSPSQDGDACPDAGGAGKDAPAPALVPAPNPASGGMHIPTYFATDGTNGRKKCVLCHRKTPLGCSNCDKALCFVATRDCYKKWHTLHNP
ncbi:piggyBac transposable element-derived protein 4-like [Sardina pilchardus]|uniref:piggyBac transposable element-derived protein 4-like n=1 Tax=Sardina pilchardus TaxID=27697 RepID=UPI002E1373C1